jgi:hypothetical protein
MLSTRQPGGEMTGRHSPSKYSSSPWFEYGLNIIFQYITRYNCEFFYFPHKLLVFSSTGMPPLLVQRCNGTTAGLGHLEVGCNAHTQIPPQAVSL